jgi:predicted dehydrogenase/aryl-alcohol dehydrogenase-like predicted oxidoreductase
MDIIMNQPLRWGILSTGRISHTFARGLAETESGVLVAVASRDQASADKFGDEFNVPHRHASYQALLANPEVEAVYISTPHPLHAQWAIRAAEAGKHILCEKPLTLNYATAMAVVEAARRNDVFLMEAFMYRCHPQTKKLVELIQSGAIGNVRVIQATFSFGAGFDPNSRLFDNALGGGGILDVGCYPTSMARLIAGAASGENQSAEPIEIHAIGHLGQSNVDEYAAAILKFPGEIIAQLSTGIAVSQDNSVRIFGDGGNIVVPSPWFCQQDGRSVILLNKNGASPEEIVIEAPKGLYAYEADTVAQYIEQRQAAWPAMTLDDTLGNMKTLDKWREAIGLVYEDEKPENLKLPASGSTLARHAKHNMKYGRITGVEKDVSRLALGTMLEGAHFHTLHGFALFDGFFEGGGNCFDSAFIYMGGKSEKIFGQWMKSRGVREEVIVLGKGAHTPFCDIENLTSQLLTSLDRLQTDYVDIYMMHRDNEASPVDEFVDALNEHKNAGRIRAFGGSNWSIARVEAANDYAASKGLAGFTAVSNNFSLARMVDPVWAGCIAASDAESRAWFEKTQMSLIPWSSQARGFFAVGDPNSTGDSELDRCWYSDDNFQRLERVKQVAAERGVLPINIALAYVLNQPFPTFPLIGPRSLHELSTSLPALDIELSPNELKWLNLEE